MATVKTRVLIISDTHCAPLEDVSSGGARPSRAFQHPLQPADVLIHCGDLTHEGMMEQYHQTIDMLELIEAPVKLVIAGNHDLSLDRDYVLGHHKQDHLTLEQAELRWKAARNLWTTGRAKAAGITFLDEGVHRIALPNGALMTAYASPYTPEFYDWGFPYERDEDRWNLPKNALADAKSITVNPIPSYGESSPDTNIDILITHGPPYDLLDETNRGDRAGCPHLTSALMRSRPLLHCFGHIHEGWGAEIMTWSSDADAVTSGQHTMQAWKQGAWRAGLVATQEVQVDVARAREQHAVFVDVSSQSGQELRRGEQSLLVNAAIMDVQYDPVNAPWVVEMDLPRAS